MSIIALLHNSLKESLPSIHATRLQALMAAVEAGLHGAPVSITALGRSLSGPAYIKHKIKRMDRLAGNHHLNTERMVSICCYDTVAVEVPSYAIDPD